MESFHRELVEKFMKQKDEAIRDGLKDLLDAGKLVVEDFPVETKVLSEGGSFRIEMNQQLRVKHSTCDTCEHYVWKGSGFCELDGRHKPQNFYCATFKRKVIELKPYSEE